MLNKLVTTVSLLSALLAATAAPQRPPTMPVPVPVPAPAGFKITSLGVLGTGCPPGTSYYVLSPDNSAVTVTFSEYFAQAGPGIPIAQNRRNCRLTFGVNVPPGFTFAIGTVDYRGYYQLDRGVTGGQSASYYFQSLLNESFARKELVGPVDGADYIYRDQFDLIATNTSPCGVSTVLNVNTELRVSNTGNRQGSGYIATDSVDAHLNTTYNFQWQTCK
ncbi:hypothetical protein FA15DRAFT_701034 [Coprinopsis marcescibilis]|uniref:Secreted protein n=1 Tax=Coprinopsis marcescibilis TaxID=230819 RepID=A0A5C3L8G4_COPMA|nr:hypothetical protein FA15DRAFT_701034 [Coprinopsis marcescibilis]